MDHGCLFSYSTFFFSCIYYSGSQSGRPRKKWHDDLKNLDHFNGQWPDAGQDRNFCKCKVGAPKANI